MEDPPCESRMKNLHILEHLRTLAKAPDNAPWKEALLDDAIETAGTDVDQLRAILDQHAEEVACKPNRRRAAGRKSDKPKGGQPDWRRKSRADQYAKVQEAYRRDRKRGAQYVQSL